jgi:hypothetical protein
MRGVVRGRAGMVVAFLLGLVIATAGTATAARLITGKQIKDGTVSSRDLSKAVRAQLTRLGVPGPQGVTVIVAQHSVGALGIGQVTWQAGTGGRAGASDRAVTAWISYGNSLGTCRYVAHALVSG